MPLTAMQPPDSVRRAVAAHVDLVATSRGAFPALRDAARENLELVAPHRMYTLPLDAIAGTRLDARPAGWRFLVTNENKVVASAEVAGEAGEAPAINAGAYVYSTAEAIPYLEQLPEIANGSFELRLLKIPALYIVAAWLVDEHRLVVPLAPAPNYIEAGHPYEEQTFLAALKEPAEAISALDDGTSGG